MGSEKSLIKKIKDWAPAYASAHKITTVIFLSVSTAVILILLISYLIILLSPLSFHISRFFVTDADSARYILSALAQSEAAILGIMFTALLIIFQVLVRGSSDIKELANLLNLPIVVITILAYAVAIGYDLILLHFVEDTSEVNVFLPILLMIFLIPFSFGAIVVMLDNIHKKAIAGGVRVGARKFLKGADLSNESFVGVKLVGADLMNAHLDGSDFTDVDLHESKLNNADLCEATFNGADLREVDLSNAMLTGVSLNGADLRGANLSDIKNMSGCNLWMANLSGANLTRANLSGVALWKANLSGAIVTGINQEDDVAESGVDLGGVNLSGAYLNGADLKKANLCRARLSGLI